MPAQPSALSFVGIAKEVTENVYAASTAFIPVKTIDFQPMQDYAKIEVLLGSMGTDLLRTPTFNFGEVTLKGPVFPDTVGWFIAGIFGDIVTTGAAAPFTHAIALKNSGNGQPTTHSVVDSYVAANRALLGVKWTDVEVTWSADGVLEYTAKGIGISQAIETKPVQSFTTITPTPAWTGVLTIGGAANSISTDGSIKIARKSEVLKVINNTQTPLTNFLTEIEVTAKIKALMEDDTVLAYYLNNTQPTFNMSFTQGAGAALTQVQFHCQVASFDKPPKIVQDPSKPVVIDAEFTALLNTTDAGASGGYSPAKITLQNAVAASTYQ